MNKGGRQRPHCARNETTPHFDALVSILLGKLRPRLRSTQNSESAPLLSHGFDSKVAFGLWQKWKGPAMAPNRGNEDCRSIAEETNKDLVGELCRGLDERHERKSLMQYPFPADWASRGLCEMTLRDSALGTHLAASPVVVRDPMANRVACLKD